jgi:dienelactone hydrolase
LPPFVSARLDPQGHLLADAADSDTYILDALDQRGWYARLLGMPPPHSVAISTETMRIGGSWGSRGTAEDAVRACGGAEIGCRPYLDRDRVVWMPSPTDPVPVGLLPPAADADTSTPPGAIAGARSDVPACRRLPDSVWAETTDGGECLRYRSSGLAQRNPMAILFLDGDEVFALFGRERRAVSGVATVIVPNSDRAAAIRRKLGDIAGQVGLPVLLVARPGTGGSSGNQWREGKTARETALLDAALDRLARRHHIAHWVVAGQSGGAALAANLLARRHDIACAALASGPLALKAQFTFQGADDRVVDALDDPMDHVAAIAPDPTRRVFVLSDPADGLVPLAVQQPWVDAAAGHGLAVQHLVYPGWGTGAQRHDLAWKAVWIAGLCGTGVPTDAIARWALGTTAAAATMAARPPEPAALRPSPGEVLGAAVGGIVPRLVEVNTARGSAGGN